MAHRRGILSAASLMVGAAASADAIRRARLMPTLRVGLHVVMVDGRPTLPSSAIPLLVNRRGWLRSDLVAMGCLLARSSQARRQLAAEISAQFEAYRATGLRLDHCNAHKHFHLHPVVSQLLISIGAGFGLRAIRVPRESRRLLAGIDPNDHGFPSIAAPFAALLRRRIRAAGLCTTDQVFGLQWSGHMTKHRLLNLIRNLPAGLSEIYLHPATGPYAGHAPGYRYRDELEALLDVEVLAAARLVKVGGFGDFMTQEAPRHAIT